MRQTVSCLVILLRFHRKHCRVPPRWDHHSFHIGAFLVYYVVTRLIFEQDRNIELRERNHRLAMNELQYDSLQERITEARRAKHDVRHHIALLKNITEYANSDLMIKCFMRQLCSMTDK